MLAILLQAATQPTVVVQAPSEWSPAAVMQILLTIGSVAVAIIAAVRGEKANAKGDANAVQVQQIHTSIQSVAERVNDVALATPVHPPALPLQSPTQSPPLPPSPLSKLPTR